PGAARDRSVAGVGHRPRTSAARRRRAPDARSCRRLAGCLVRFFRGWLGLPLLDRNLVVREEHLVSPIRGLHAAEPTDQSRQQVAILSPVPPEIDKKMLRVGSPYEEALEVLEVLAVELAGEDVQIAQKPAQFVYRVGGLLGRPQLRGHRAACSFR